MRVPCLLLALAFACGLAGGLSAPAAAAPLEAYARLPTIEGAAVSPSGKQVALVITDGEVRGIVVEDVETHQVTLRTRTGSAKVRRVSWAGDGHLIIVTSTTSSPFDVITTQREWLMGFSMDVATGKFVVMLRDVERGMNVLQDMPVVRDFAGEPAVFVEGVKFVGNEGHRTLFRVDLNTGGSRVVEVGDTDVRNWVLGVDGQPVAKELFNTRTGRWALRVKGKDGWREAATEVSALEPPSMIGLGRDGKAVLYMTRDGASGAVWKEVRLDDAPAGPPLNVNGRPAPILDPNDGRLIGQRGRMGETVRYNFFDPEDTRTWNAVTAAFVGSQVELQSWSRDRRRIVVRVDSPTEGPGYALVDLGTREARWLGQEYAGVKAADLSPRAPVTFKASDGLQLGGYLTLPRGRPAKALPLIVFPHGGPASRDEPGFDWGAQAMASRGYAVLQVNFRGSDGLGQGLLTAGYGQWGRKMQTDLSDGVAYLAKEGTIDPKRVCIVGASYGGYAALAGAALDPGVYRCAASYGGLSDLRRFVDWSRNMRGSLAFRYWTRFMGAEASSDAVLGDISPAVQVDKIAVPVLLIHGKDDSVVPLEQSQIMANALRKAGKPVELVVLKGEDHWLSRGDTRLQMLATTMAFVEKNNPPN